MNVNAKANHPRTITDPPESDQVLASGDDEVTRAESEGDALLAITTAEVLSTNNGRGDTNDSTIKSNTVTPVAPVGVGESQGGSKGVVNLNGDGLGPTIGALQDIELSPALDRGGEAGWRGSSSNLGRGRAALAFELVRTDPVRPVTVCIKRSIS